MSAIHDSHRLFLQTFMSQGMLGRDDVHDAFRESCTRYGGKQWNKSSVILLTQHAMWQPGLFMH